LTNANDLCSSLTHDRTPCNARRVGWTRFCWHHQPWREIGLSTVIALLVGVNATWFIALRMSQLANEIARSSQGSTNPCGRDAQLRAP